MVFLRAFSQGYLGRERPSHGVLLKCKLRSTAVPIMEAKKGVAPVQLRSPPIGTAGPFSLPSNGLPFRVSAAGNDKHTSIRDPIPHKR